MLSNHFKSFMKTTPLSEAALRKQNTNMPLAGYLWEIEERKRIERLQRAAIELGFELPPQCYQR
jgi:hypothetical protein